MLNSLKPILEEWCQKKLSKEVVIYGIRRYLRGAWLSLHVDQLPTHIISVILQVMKKKLSTDSSKDFEEVLDTMDPNQVSPDDFCLP